MISFDSIKSAIARVFGLESGVRAPGSKTALSLVSRSGKPGGASDFAFKGGSTHNTWDAIQAVIKIYQSSPILRQLALDIIKDVPEKDAWAEARAMFEWVRQWKYVKDPTAVELIHTPPRILNNIVRFRTISDCDDFTILLASLLLQIGHRVQLRMIGPYPKGHKVRVRGKDGKMHEVVRDDFTHIYLADQLPGPAIKTRHGEIRPPVWVPLDAINKQQPMGWEAPHRRMETFTF